MLMQRMNTKRASPNSNIACCYCSIWNDTWTTFALTFMRRIEWKIHLTETQLSLKKISYVNSICFQMEREVKCIDKAHTHTHARLQKKICRQFTMAWRGATNFHLLDTFTEQHLKISNQYYNREKKEIAWGRTRQEHSLYRNHWTKTIRQTFAD